MQTAERQHPYSFIKTGYSAYQKGNYTVAIANYNYAIHLSPQDPNVYRLRADAKIKLGQYQEAIIDCNTTIQLDRFNPAYLTRGFAHYFSYQNENALADFNMAISLNYNPAYAYKYRADIKRDMHRFYEARVDYQKALILAKQCEYELLIAQILPCVQEMYLRTTAVRFSH